MNLADYKNMLAGLDADIAESRLAPHLGNPVAVAFNAGNFDAVAFQADTANQIDL